MANANRESITKLVNDSYTHKKQSGGSGQFAKIDYTIEPGEPGTGFLLESKFVGGSIPKEFIPAVEKGFKACVDKGPPAGYPCLDFKVTINEGGFHATTTALRLRPVLHGVLPLRPLSEKRIRRRHRQGVGQGRGTPRREVSGKGHSRPVCIFILLSNSPSWKWAADFSYAEAELTEHGGWRLILATQVVLAIDPHLLPQLLGETAALRNQGVCCSAVLNPF